MNPGFVASYRRPAATKGWTDAAAHTGKAAIVALAPRETGFLKMNVRTRTFPGRKGPDVRYEAFPEYALYQELGTGLYGPRHRWITPKRARMLSWIDSRTGDRRFARRVRGVRPQRYFKRGLEATYGRRAVRYYGAGRLGRIER